MEIRFNIQKNERKALAQKIAELTGAEVKYLGVPSCAYQIGSMTLSKDSVLSGEELSDDLLGALHDAGYAAEKEPTKLTVSLPRDFFSDQALDNLRRIISNKGTLMQHAFGTDTLDIAETDGKIEFPWFTLAEDGDSAAYTQFVSMLCAFAKERKRVPDKPDTSDNEKYAFRCFLLRLGMIGAEFKQSRKVLLRNLTGSSAFRYGKGGADNEISD